MKTVLSLATFTLFILLIACGGEADQKASSGDTSKRSETKIERKADPRGIGEITKVELTDPLDQHMIKLGKAISEMKCASCHKYDTEERLVGPGFKNVTNKRSPEWIMNMITNVDVMLDQDPVARKLLEECLVRMPNQNISVDEARDILEFLRHNDEKHAETRDGGVI